METKLLHNKLKIDKFQIHFLCVCTVKNLRISKFQYVDPLADQISYPTLKAIVKYRYHPSYCKKNATKSSNFHFSYASRNETKNSRIDQVKFLKAVFHKFYLVHS